MSHAFSSRGSGTLDREMAPRKKNVVVRRHLVCGNCASWVHYETSGCEKKWADTRAEGFVFGEGRTEERMEICAGTTTGVSQDRGETAGNSRTEDRNGHVGYAPAAFLVVIPYTTAEEQERDATKKGQGNSTEDNRIGGRIGQEGEGRKSYSAASRETLRFTLETLSSGKQIQD